jgi:hypothetical protein
MNKLRILIVALLCAAMFAFSGCGETDTDNTDSSDDGVIEKSVDDMEDAVDDVVDDTEDVADKAADDVEDTVDNNKTKSTDTKSN